MKGRDHSDNLGADGKIMFNWDLGKWVGTCGLNASGSGQGPVTDSCECNNKPSSSRTDEEFLD
jgi:hypothetical protein